MAGANMVDPELEKFRNLETPDVVLVRKSYSEKRRARRERGKGERYWKLKRMAVEAADGVSACPLLNLAITAYQSMR